MRGKRKKKEFARKLLSGVLSAALLSTSLAIPADAAALPEPVFAMNFDAVTQGDGENISGTFAADTGETVTVHDVVSVTADRKGGKALVLDNVSGKQGYLTTPNTDELNGSSLTASVWLKRLHSLNGDGRVFWAKKGAQWDGNGWFMGWTAGESMAFVSNGGNVASKIGTPNDGLPENEWTNIVSVFDDQTDTITIYQDGEVIAEKYTAGASITKNTDITEMMIGCSGYGDEGLGCAIDDVAVYDCALTADQVAELAGFTEQDFLDSDAENLTVAKYVTADFTLPLKGARGSEITWTSDHEAIRIGADGRASVTRTDKNVEVTLTATLTYGSKKTTKAFQVTVVKTAEPVDGLQKLDSSEIIDVGGSIGAKLKDAMQNYAMDYLYGQRMQAYLDEYKNHSHSAWSWLEGEQPGKWLEAMSNCKWMDKDGSIEAAITDVVDQLAATQTKEDRSASGYNQFAGYLGNATPAIRSSKPVKGMDPYEMYSTLNGLVNVYQKYQADNEALADKAFACAVGLADYLVNTIGDENTKVLYQDGTPSNVNKVEFWPLAITNGTTIAGHDVHQSWEGTLLIDPIMQLSRTIAVSDSVRSETYSAWVDWAIGNIDKWASSWSGYGDTPFADLDKVAGGEMGIDAVQHYVHAHTFQMNFLGFLKKYQETGDVSYLDKVAGAWKDITSRQMYITGTVSVGEHYEAGHNLPNTGSVGETCATNSWTLLNQNLFELTGDTAYEQVVEDVLFNHMFATSTIDGDGYSYHRPLNGTTDRFYTGPDCCSSSGMRMQSYLPYYLYSKSDTEVYVNQFVSNEVKIRLEKGILHLKMETDYPANDEIKLEVMSDSTAVVPLKIRIPGWLTAEPSVTVNGKETAASADADFITLNVEKGDKIILGYPSELTWVKGENSNEGLWAIKKGPMVYCQAAAFVSSEESQKLFGSDIAFVNMTGVVGAEDGAAVETAGKTDYPEERILGDGYQIKVNTAGGEQEMVVVPYANIGQWYRYGEARPADYNSAVRYPYRIWMTDGVSDYPAEPDDETKPVVHYDFDDVDGTVVKDISGNGHDAALRGGAAIADNGRLGKMLQLNGTDAYVELPDDVIYGLYRMSISAWVKPEELGNWARLFDFGSELDPPYPNLFLTLNSGNNNLRFAYEEDGGSSFQVNGGSPLKLNEWNHVAVMISGTKAVLYVNGEKIAENAEFQFLPSSISGMVSNLIGKSHYTADSYYKGGIDDFRIYNRELSAEELKALAAGEEPVKVIQTAANPDDVRTKAGVAPVLPERVSVSYTDGTNGKEPVVWEKIPTENYAAAGTFEVKGKVGELEVTVKVIVEEEAVQKLVEDIFEDMHADNWHRDAVQYVYDHGIMTGLDDTHFGPAVSLSRGQFALILYRLDGGKGGEQYRSVFRDVPDNKKLFYLDAVMWASRDDVQVITGYTDEERKGMFGPADEITREQMATMMYRYAQHKGYDTDAADDLSGFPDGRNVSSFADKQIKWAVGAGLIKGNDDGTLAPQGSVSRAMCATIIQRFMENVAK